MVSRLAPRNTIAKHQLIAPTRMISGARAIQRKMIGISVRDTTAAITARTKMPAKDSTIGRMCGDSRFGWSRMTTIAQTSSITSRPSAMRPGTVSSSNASWKSFTTSSVDEKAIIIPK